MRLLVVCLTSLLIGCAGADVAVDSQFPPPLVNRIDLSMGIHLSEELTSFVHEEDLDNNGEWRINIGSAQQRMFSALFEGMFRSHQIVVTPDEENTNVDGVLSPTISELQFTIPSQTRSDYFEVWIKYQMRLYDNTGDLVAEWPLTAYGKANTKNFGFMESASAPGMRQATTEALRDAMAFFSLQFTQVPEVKKWLSSKTDHSVI